MRLDHLWISDFRNYAAAELALPPGLVVIVGDNGAGKTNLLEAIAYLTTLSSFRGAGQDALVRAGAPQAVVRGEGDRAGRALLIEAEIKPTGRGRITVNRQPLRRSADITATLRVSVFSPDDLAASATPFSLKPEGASPTTSRPLWTCGTPAWWRRGRQ
ncbi:MAG: AAA family ATPase [Actinobacteria bacterium]|nr:AAA family ATPase [Actinomycetota bacterium]